MVVVVSLEGVAGVGKTTVAKLLDGRRINGDTIVAFELEAEDCWPINISWIRQECFLEKFLETILYLRRTFENVKPNTTILLSNGLLTVEAYSHAFMRERYTERLGLIAAAARTLRRLVFKEWYYSIVVDAEWEEVKNRILNRYEYEENREPNAVELDFDLHRYARDILLSYARDERIPIVDTTSLKPREAAEKVYETLRRMWGV